MRKRIASLFLVLALCLSLLPTAALAEETQDTTPENDIPVSEPVQEPEIDEAVEAVRSAIDALPAAEEWADLTVEEQEAAAEDAGVDPTHFYTTRTLAEAFLAACDKERMESFAPLFTGSSTAGQAALAALLPNTFLQALVWRTLTASALPEVTKDEGL